MIDNWRPTDEHGTQKSTNAFPKAEIVFKAWDGDKAVWPLAVESADKEAW